MVIAKKIPDSDYFAIGGTKRDDIVVSASMLRAIYNIGFYRYLIEPEPEYSEEALEAFEVGKALHAYILEPKEFEKRYSFEKNPFEDKKVLDREDEDFLKTIKKQIELLHPEFLESYKGGNGVYSLNEITLIGELDGVKAKGKLDRVVIDTKNKIVSIYDLKTIYKPLAKIKRDKNHKAWDLRRSIDETHLDLQMAWYKRLIREYLISSYGDVGMQFEIACKLLFASKEDNKVLMVRLSEDDVLLKGNEKVDIAFGEVKNFVLNGQIDKEIVV